MSWAYNYDPRLWPALISGGLTLFLILYSWRWREVPGVKFFALGSFFATLWALGSVLEIAAVDFATKVFWVKFQVVWQLPAATAMPAFVLVYAGLGRYLTRRNLVLLSIPPIIALVLIVTNDYHHLIWAGFQMDGYLVRFPGALNRTLVGYANILGLASVVVLAWLAIHSPHHRWPAVIMLIGQTAGRTVYALNIYTGFLDPGEVILVVFSVWFLAYAVPIFRYHVLDPVPLARSAVIEQMGDGMLVLDLQGKIADSNPAAERIFGSISKSLLGSSAAKLLPAYASLLAQSAKVDVAQAEISLGNGKALRYFNLDVTSLKDQQGQSLGHLLLLREITEQKQAQEKILDQQRMVATLKERERLARELHDSIGQVLGYVSIQAQTARKWTQEGNTEKAGSLLDRLVEVARDAHADVRESILSLKTGSPQEWRFVPALKQYLDTFQAHYGIRIDLSLSDEIGENTFDPAAGVQILRVIQECLANAHKHSGASMVKIRLEVNDDRAHINITDDGRGFDTGQPNPDGGSHFGLSFMRERLEQIGGSVTVESNPGAGTVVRLEVPVRD